MELRDIDKISLWCDNRDRGKALSLMGPCFTGIEGERIVGAAGLILLWPGVAQAWAVFSRSFPGLSAHRAIVKGFAGLIDSCRLHRIQAQVLASFEAGHEWVKRLGFEYEGPKKKYGPDRQDYVEYVRLP
jgi:hypothetical protein